MLRALPTWLIDLLSPLSLAAYAAWIAVWLSLGAAIERTPENAVALHACAIGFLALFMTESACGSRLPLSGFVAIGVLMTLLALLVAALAPHSAGPILLVLAAAMWAAGLTGPALWLALGLQFAAFAAVVFLLWPGQPRWLAVSLGAYVSFQLFAALVMGYAKRAEAMSAQLLAVNADLIATRSLLSESARDAERLRLSRELHDVAGHALTALKLNLGVLARDRRQPDAERVALCAGLADELLQNLRGVVRQMRAHEGIDLREAIERLAAPFPKPRIELQIDPQARVASFDTAEALLRTVQEGLTNAARHAAADTLWLRLQRDDDGLLLQIRDDGRGAANLRPGNGLRGMRERLQAVGGDLQFERAAEGGLQITARLPAAAQ